MRGWRGLLVIGLSALVVGGAPRSASPAFEPGPPSGAHQDLLSAAPGRAYATLAGSPTPEAERDTRRIRSVPHSSPPFVSPAKRTALIIGINRAKGTPPLPGSVRDALNLKQALLDYGFVEGNITLLLESEATRPAILSEMASLAARTPPSGIAVFAIATHTKRRGGTNLLATAEGARISAHELAHHLAAVRAPMWVALPTCYAGGYQLPGIVGADRVATFASAADRRSYQAGSAGSFLFIHLVRRAMIEQRAPASVEQAFGFARAELEREFPEHVPFMSDGVPGELVLGPVKPSREDAGSATNDDAREPSKRPELARNGATDADRPADPPRRSGRRLWPAPVASLGHQSAQIRRAATIPRKVRKKRMSPRLVRRARRIRR